MGNTLSRMLEDMMKYEIGARALTRSMKPVDDLPRFANRVIARFTRDVVAELDNEGFRIDKIRTSVLATLIENAVESEARLIGKWNEEPDDDMPPVPQELRDKMRELFMKVSEIR